MTKKEIKSSKLSKARKKKTSLKLMTPEGYKKLLEEKRKYERKLAEIRRGKAQAYETGGDGWHDNYAFEEIERLEKLYTAHLAEFQRQLRGVRVLTEFELLSNAQKDEINIGSLIKIKCPDGKTRVIKIVGAGESDPKRGEIAYNTPLGKAIMGKRAGETISFMIEGKTIKIQIIELIKPIKGG